MYSFCRTCWTHCYGVVVARKHVAHDLRTGSGWSAQPMTAARIDAIEARRFLVAIDKAIELGVEGDVSEYVPSLDDFEF